MSFTAHSLADRPALRAHFQRLHRVAWPPFLVDDEVNALWDTLYRDFPAFQLGGRRAGARAQPSIARVCSSVRMRAYMRIDVSRL